MKFYLIKRQMVAKDFTVTVCFLLQGFHIFKENIIKVDFAELLSKYILQIDGSGVITLKYGIGETLSV